MSFNIVKKKKLYVAKFETEIDKLAWIHMQAMVTSTTHNKLEILVKRLWLASYGVVVRIQSALNKRCRKSNMQIDEFNTTRNISNVTHGQRVRRALKPLVRLQHVSIALSLAKFLRLKFAQAVTSWHVDSHHGGQCIVE